MAAFCFTRLDSPLPEIALVFVRLNHVARSIVNVNHRIGFSFCARNEKLTAFVELESAIRTLRRIVLTSSQDFF
jgi:hypothetical protein